MIKYQFIKKKLKHQFLLIIQYINFFKLDFFEI